MERTKLVAVPAEVAKVRGRVERWRKTREKRSRMPEELWDAAARLARSHGVNPIAQALGLDYYSLKRRVQAASGAGKERKPVFVELAPRTGACVPECIVELVRPDGARMTIRMAGDGDGKLVPLSEAFWRAHG